MSEEIGKLPLVTCPILTYQKFEHIYEAIDSILYQTYKRIEIAVFDDGSDIFPGDEIKDYINKNKRQNIENVIVYHNPVNVGTVKNENIMIKSTHGQYFIEIGQDDRLHDDKVCEDVVNYFLKTNAYVVAAFRQLIDLNGKKVKIIPNRLNGRRVRDASAEKLYHMIAAGVSIAGAGTFFSRKIYEECGYYDEDFLLQEDGPFFLKISREGYKIHFFERVAFDYRVGEGVSSSPAFRKELINDIKRMYRKEIDPYIDRFSGYERRLIKYQKERLRYNRMMKKKEKVKLGLKYPDVVLYRMLFSH